MEKLSLMSGLKTMVWDNRKIHYEQAAFSDFRFSAAASTIGTRNFERYGRSLNE